MPTGIKSTDGLAGLTAQQWKIFACVYVKPCFVGLLSDKFFKSLCLLCEIVVCISKPTLNEEDIVNLYRMVQDHQKHLLQPMGNGVHLSITTWPFIHVMSFPIMGLLVLCL